MVLGLVVLIVSMLVRFCVTNLSWLAVLFFGLVVVLVAAAVSWLVEGWVLLSVVRFRVLVGEFSVRYVMLMSVVLGSVVMCVVEARIVVSVSVIMMSWSVG